MTRAYRPIDTGLFYGVPLRFHENVIDPTFAEMQAAQARYHEHLRAEEKAWLSDQWWVAQGFTVGFMCGLAAAALAWWVS